MMATASKPKAAQQHEVVLKCYWLNQYRHCQRKRLEHDWLKQYQSLEELIQCDWLNQYRFNRAGARAR